MGVGMLLHSWMRVMVEAEPSIGNAFLESDAARRDLGRSPDSRQRMDCAGLSTLPSSPATQDGPALSNHREDPNPQGAPGLKALP